MSMLELMLLLAATATVTVTVTVTVVRRLLESADGSAGSKKQDPTDKLLALQVEHSVLLLLLLLPPPPPLLPLLLLLGCRYPRCAHRIPRKSLALS